MSDATHRSVEEYYGEVLKHSSDLKTSACCPAGAVPVYLEQYLSTIDDEIIGRSYGCGSPIPLGIEGCTVLDLGCGTGRDVYLCSQLVGEEGQVIGIDMTPQQLEVARRHRASHADRFGRSEEKIRFVDGYLEDLAAAGIEDDSVDVVISNCVINLAPDKRRIFEEIKRVLRPGGEFHFSDIFCDRRLSPRYREDPVLLGECLAGSLYFEDFRRMWADLGISDVRLLSSSAVALRDAEVEEKIGFASFRSLTVSVFNLEGLEDRCEDYGQTANYRGTVPHAPHRFGLDDHHIFERNRPVNVCSNTAMMLAETRFKNHFLIDGDLSYHHGLFPCGPVATEGSDENPCC
ncbi:MAG TPA: methyltransferase domain-containing protein [Planctomycetes bacterium]|nr:methyltransferase domain-containing protein [Planctomycetota bacterium]HIN81257.1 methyltransferase domain-containing protein [Planctomycetota bacterium]